MPLNATQLRKLADDMERAERQLKPLFDSLRVEMDLGSRPGDVEIIGKVSRDGIEYDIVGKLDGDDSYLVVRWDYWSNYYGDDVLDDRIEELGLPFENGSVTILD